jgi:hypothetical protein
MGVAAEHGSADAVSLLANQQVTRRDFFPLETLNLRAPHDDKGSWCSVRQRPDHIANYSHNLGTRMRLFEGLEGVVSPLDGQGCQMWTVCDRPG